MGRLAVCVTSPGNPGGIAPPFRVLSAEKDAGSALQDAAGAINKSFFVLASTAKQSRAVGRLQLRHRPEWLRRARRYEAKDSLFLVAHVHNVMVSAVLLGAFAGYADWFPRAFGFQRDEWWGKAAFWFGIPGFVLVFGAFPTFVVFAWRDTVDYEIPAAIVARVTRANRRTRLEALRGASQRRAA